jgi:hypothetical protein
LTGGLTVDYNRHVFPADRVEKRRVLLAAVKRARPVIKAHADEAEAMATLPKATVDALVGSGLLRLKLPAVLGGAEADPVPQMEVIEAVSRIDAAAGWCVMIGASAIGSAGTFLPDEALALVFPAGRVPTAAGVFMPTGEARPVDGGYRGGPALHGERLRVREPRAVPARPARGQPAGMR